MTKLKLSLLKKIFIGLTYLLSVAIQANGWKLIAEEDNIKVYSPKELGGVLPFRAEGVVEHNIELVLELLKNTNEKPNWAPKLKKVSMHENHGESAFIFSEYYKTPWPSTDREFLLKGEVERKDYGYLLNARSVDYFDPNKLKYKDDDHIQVDVKTLELKLKRLDDSRTLISFEFHGDMKGWMPVWLMNLIQKKWPLRFIQGIRGQLEKSPSNKGAVVLND